MRTLNVTCRFELNDLFKILFGYDMWSMFRRLKSEWWIRFFHDLEMFGLFRRGNVTDL